MDEKKYIIELFDAYIDRQPSDQELELHLKRFRDLHKYNKESIINEFKNCEESKRNKEFNEYNVDVLIQYKKNYMKDNASSFNPVLCVDEKSNNMIIYSNSYLLNGEMIMKNPKICGSPYSLWYESQYHIYEAIEKNHMDIKNRKYDYIVEENSVYFCNAFMDSNIGHSCAHNFAILENYFQKHLNITAKIVIIEDIIPNMLKLLHIFFDESQIIKLEKDKIYKFKNIYIPYPEILSIDRNIITISKIINYCTTVCNKETLKRKKIILIKTISNKTQTISADFIEKMSQEMINYCESKNVLIIEPGNHCIYELIYMLKNADIILASRGAISYTHMIYFNKLAKLYLIKGPYMYSSKLPFKNIPTINLKVLQNIFET